MGWFNKLTARKEVRAALGVLDEIACIHVSNQGIAIPSAQFWHETEAFRIVRGMVEEVILANQDGFARNIQNGTSVRQWVWAVIANMSCDRVETGEYHIYRGVLNPLGPGEYLLRLFDTALEELVKNLTRLHAQPARPPANACGAPLRTHRHSSGPARGATASPYGSSIHYSPPVTGASPRNSLLTLAVRPCGRIAIARGRFGALLPHRMALPSTTLRQLLALLPGTPPELRPQKKNAPSSFD